MAVAQGSAAMYPTCSRPDDAPPPHELPHHSVTRVDVPACATDADPVDTTTPGPPVPLEDDKASTHTDVSASGSVSSSNSDMGALLEAFAGDPHANVELFPVVHLWVDFTSSFHSENDIANPIHLYEERDAVVRYALVVLLLIEPKSIDGDPS